VLARLDARGLCGSGRGYSHGYGCVRARGRRYGSGCRLPTEIGAPARTRSYKDEQAHAERLADGQAKTPVVSSSKPGRLDAPMNEITEPVTPVNRRAPVCAGS